MAHELATRADGKTAHAYVGETPWHGLGQQLTKGASIGVWQKEAGLDWEALEGVPTIDTGDELISFTEHKTLHRSDTKAPLSIVGSGYNIVQPVEVLEFFRDLVEQEGWYIHTAGVLKGGRKLWAMATNDESALVGRGDKVNHNLLLATSLDGSLATTAMETSVRVVCNNTLTMAVNRENDRAVRVSHRSIFYPELVKRALGVQQDRFKAFMNQAKQLADTPVNLEDARTYLERIFQLDKQAGMKPDLSWMKVITPEGPVDRDRPTTKGLELVLDLFQGAGKGADLKTARGTRWGLLNAVTQHVDWAMGRTDDTRIDSAWFGRGAGFKNDALAILTEDF
jgi:phage/plasmid-like protein (TIGR03299 family)